MTSTTLPKAAPALAALYAKRPQVIKPGLTRIAAGLAALAADQLDARPKVLVAGTNGKGTTSGFLWQLLSALGIQTGLFTSPHLLRFEERIQTSQRPVTEDLLVAELGALQADLPPAVYEPMSFFEINTLLALRVFKHLGTAVDVLEVGLGGRWDATNATTPDVSVITSIGLDHQEFLGTTPAAVAGEKAGILRPGRPVIWGGAAAGGAEADAVIRARAASLGCPMLAIGDELQLTPTHFTLQLPELPRLTCAWPRAAAAWPGFLRANFVLAAAALLCLLRSSAAAAVYAPLLRAATADDPRLVSGGPGEAHLLQTAVAALDTPEHSGVRTPPSRRGRFERLDVYDRQGRARAILLDVAHNPDGVRALVAGLRETGLLPPGRQVPGCLSILADKDCDQILDLLRPHLAPLTLFASTSERSWTPQRVAPRHRDLPFYADFSTAFAALPADPGPTVVCGSVYAVGEVCAALGISIS